jgi:probable F420-dependent oxidoreductase
LKLTGTAVFSAGLPKSIDAPLAAFARRAEDVGFHGLWTVDHAVGETHAQDPSLDALHTLTYVAALTKRVRLGVAVLVMPRRNPAQLARDLATLDVLSGGRLTVGVGLGGADPGAVKFGFRAGNRAKHLVEGVAVMRALWTMEEASHAGDLYDFTGAHLQPKPLQKPHPPIWFGARSHVALERAARLADGWIGSGSSSAQEFGEQLRTLRAALSEAGRDPDSFPISKRVYIAVDADKARAQARLAPILDHIYRRPGITEQVAVCGDPRGCAEQLRTLVELGAQELILNPLYDELAQLDLLARVVELVRA